MLMVRRETPILVAGSGRSGTTWIGDTLATAADASPIFEPLHPQGPEWPTLPPLVRSESLRLPGVYLRATDRHPAWGDFWAKVFTGTLTNAWTRQDWRRIPEVIRLTPFLNRWVFRGVGLISRRAMRSRSRTLVKEIHGNLQLPWITRNLEVRVVYIIRHPCAVVSSRLRLKWPDTLEGILRQPMLMEDWLNPFTDLIEGASTPVERMAVLWCVENLIPIRNWHPQWLLVSHEELTLSPSQGYQRLFSALNLQHTEEAEVVSARLCSTPGPKAGKITRWCSGLSQDDAECVLRICEKFGLDFYRRQAVPDLDRLKAILADTV